MASDERTTLIVDRYAAQQATLITQLVRALLGIWAPFVWWGRPDMVNAYAARSAVQVDVALSQTRRQARAYAVALLRELDAAPGRLPDPIDTYERGGTPIVEVYKRPARQLEHAKRIKKPSDEQIRAFEDRLTSIVADDVRITARDEIQKVNEAAPKVIGYRRVLHPELTRTGPCGLCIVAASRFYTVKDLLELHGGCVCETLPITADSDPGLRLNRADLDAIYAAAGSNYAEDLKRIRVTVREHGELGPILVREGNSFREVDDVNRESKRREFTPYKRMTQRDDVTQWSAMRATSERSIEILEAARDAGTNLVDITGGNSPIPVKDIEKAIEFHRSLIARAARHAA
ncbi:hypothetical protein [Microbacterium lacus]|uniref:hypothetical protein n=1 Tax=Microbacterium lacus TaxID=415217 RepID=UPI000C2B866E|nr:hypothetical protein [Microbacterium lacus]